MEKYMRLMNSKHQSKLHRECGESKQEPQPVNARWHLRRSPGIPVGCVRTFVEFNLSLAAISENAVAPEV